MSLLDLSMIFGLPFELTETSFDMRGVETA